MQVERDYEDLLRSLNRNKVRYCIVGAYALAFHAIPRYTKDMDILVEPTKENGERIIKALKEFGFERVDLSPDDFTEESVVIQLGYEPVRVDLVTSIDGCSFEEVWNGRIEGKYGNEKVNYIGLHELIKNKESSGRKQDIADLEVLRKVEGE